MAKEEQLSEKELEKKREEEFKKKLEELRKRDPFVYKNF